MPAHEPADLHAAFAAAIEARDVEALLALYEPDGLATHLDGERYAGTARLRGMLADLVGSVVRFSGATRKVLVVGELALTSARWEGEFVAPDGSRRSGSGVTAELARRQPDGTWRWVIDDPLF